MTIKIALAALCVAGLASAGNAVTVTYSQSFTPVGYNWSDSIALSQFDPSLGTLTGIHASLYSTLSGTTYVESKLDHSWFYTPFNSLFTGLQLPNIGEINNYAGWIAAGGYTSPFDGMTDFSGPGTISGSGTGSALTSDTVFDFTGYVGTGTVAATIRGGISYPTGIHSYLDANVLSYANATSLAWITYTYDQAIGPPAGGVPEPATWAMLVSGFGLCGMVMRRRSRVVTVTA
jgi:hypothetical protein